MKSNYNKNYGLNPDIKQPRSSYTIANRHLTTFNGDYLIPIKLKEVYPGDTISESVNMLGRFSTMINPVMDNVVVNVYAFFVPNRLVNDKWKQFMGESSTAGISNYTGQVPYYNIGKDTNDKTHVEYNSLGDYFGIPPMVNTSDGIDVSQIPFRGYRQIWNDWFRDQNLQDELSIVKDDVPTDFNKEDNPLLKKNKRRDYFTSALPYAQKGQEVSIGLGGTAPVISDGKQLHYYHPNHGMQDMVWKDDETVRSARNIDVQNVPVYWGSQTGLQADLGSASSITINQLREAVTTQQFYEIDARGGTRYTELTESHFGVTNPDARLQRAEFLGYSKMDLNVHSVAQTVNLPDGNIGDLGAFGTMNTKNNNWLFNKSFTEHGYVFIMVCASADITYSQGLARHWSRRDRLDYMFPVFANIGEQEILNKEIYVSGDKIKDNEVFGYTPAWEDLRTDNSLITGTYRPSHPQTLDTWHLSQNFANTPTLSSTFIEQNTPFNRVKTVQTEPDFQIDTQFITRTTRCLPSYGTPGITKL